MIITVEKFKSLTGTKNNLLDDQIAELIPAVEDDYLAIRGKSFDTAEDGSIVYPAGAVMTVAEMISYKLLTLPGRVGASGESISDYSVSLDTDLIHGYPKGIVTKIDRYGRAR